MSELIRSIVLAVVALWQESFGYLSHVFQESFSYLEQLAEQHLAVCSIALTLIVFAHFIVQAFRSPPRF